MSFLIAPSATKSLLTVVEKRSGHNQGHTRRTSPLFRISVLLPRHHLHTNDANIPNKILKTQYPKSKHSQSDENFIFQNYSRNGLQLQCS